MPAKKKLNYNIDDDILNDLKKRYFKLIQVEKIGKTPEITKKLDELEKYIRERVKDLNK